MTKLIIRIILTGILAIFLISCSTEEFKSEEPQEQQEQEEQEEEEQEEEEQEEEEEEQEEEINFDDLLDESHKINDIIDRGIYTIKGNASQKYLQVIDTSTVNGANVEISSAIQNTEDIEAIKNQQWLFNERGVNPNNDRKIYEIRNNHSGRSLDIEESSMINGGNLQQYQFGNNDNQLWEIVKYNEYWYFINYKSRRIIDVMELGTSDGSNVYQWSFTGKSNQQWIVEYQEP